VRAFRVFVHREPLHRRRASTDLSFFFFLFLHLQTTEALLIDAAEEHKSNNEHTQ